MNFDLSAEQKAILETVKDFGEGEIRPAAADMDAAGQFPAGLIEKLSQLGMLSLLTPEEYGGAAIDTVSYCLAIRELSKASASVGIAVSVHNTTGCYPIARFGNEEQKKRFLPLLTRELAAFSVTEPSAGSDAGAMGSTAVKNGSDYVINGSKIFVTNGELAKVFIIFAKTEQGKGTKGVSAFIVERGTDGLKIGKPEKKMGLKASQTVGLHFEDMKVPEKNRLGEEGEGFKIALTALDLGRIGVGAQAVGISMAAFDEAVKYSKERVQFGHPISNLQAIQWMLAEMDRRIQCSDLLVMRAAWLKDKGMKFTKEAAMAKLYSSEAATYVTHRAIQIHGGYGYTKDYAVERFYRDARVTEIYEGTSEIQRLVIANNLLA